MQCLNFFQQQDSNGQILKSFTCINILAIVQKDEFLKLILIIQKNGYPLAPDKIEIKRKILSDYQLKIADLYSIPIGNVKKLVPKFFDKEKYVLYYQNLQLYLRQGLKLKKNTSRISQSRLIINHNVSNHILH